MDIKCVNSKTEDTETKLENLETFTVEGFSSISKNQEMIYNEIDGIQESLNDYWFSLYHQMKNGFKSLKILYVLSSLLMIITVIVLVAVLCYIKL